MTNTEIVEGNKLIAEFMGFVYCEENVHDNYEPRMDNVYSKVPIEIFEDEGLKFFKELPNPDFKKEKPEKWNPEFGLLNWQTLNHGQFMYGVLEYHSSWSWLMPVVERIGNIPPNRFVIDNNECKIIGDTKIKVFNASKILSVYECVIKFIKWYNQGKEDEGVK